MQPTLFHISSETTDLVSHSGFALIGTLLESTDLRKRLDRIAVAGRPRPEIGNGDVCAAMIGLVAMGKPDFAAIEEWRDEPFFLEAMGLAKAPSEATLRQRLDDLGSAPREVILEESAALTRRHAPVVSACWGDRVALDIDVSPFDNSGTKKEGVSRTYKQVDGYSPIFAYLGEEGYLVNLALREGRQHCQKGTAEFLKESIGLARGIVQAPLLVRMDAGNDSADNIRVCRKEKADWIVARNLRNEKVDEWLETAWAFGEVDSPREGKTVLTGETHMVCDGRLERVVFRVTERTTSADGQLLLFPDMEVRTWWTSLKCPAAEVISLYHAHATSEQFHSELKTDLALERLPSGKFATNALVLLLGMVAYNCLRLIDQRSLSHPEDLPPSLRRRIEKRGLRRRRLRTVIQDLMYLAARIVRHARSVALKFGRHSVWSRTWRRVYDAARAAPASG